MKNIALAMSGGGFRAAAFSLGAISYLAHLKSDRVPLLEKVRFIGSTSGGSITNLAYGSGICRGASFGEIYCQLLGTLEGERVIMEAFKLLEDDALWEKYPDKNRNLINAFSMAYNELLFAGEQLDLLNTGLGKTHVEEICVNSTELANGLSFRFQSQHPEPGISNGKVGNGYIHFKTGTSGVFGKLKLADILAASSCFPGGFEPLVFPEDFTHPQLASSTLSDAINFRENPFSTQDNPEDLFKDDSFKSDPRRFAMLDGGIADNQAIDSVLLANQRRADNGRPPFDLIVICDVTSYLMDGFTLPMQKHSFLNNFSARTTQHILLLLAILFLPTVAGLFIFGWNPYLTLLLLPLTAAFAVYLFGREKIGKARKDAHETKSTWGIIFFRYVGYFLKLRLGLVTQMLASRLKSVFLITSDVYLKQIRAHYYTQLFSDDKLRNITVTNAIYDLSIFKQRPRKPGGKVPQEAGFASAGEEIISNESNPQPSDAICKMAEKARLVATTLWFDENSRENQEKEAVIATGQFTLCYNLIRHLLKVRDRAAAWQADSAAPDVTQPVFGRQEAAMLEALQADWSLFNEDPLWLHKQMVLHAKL